MKNDTALIEWDGKEYLYRYTFAEIMAMRARGINFAKVYRLVTTKPDELFDEVDQISAIIGHILGTFGVQVTTEQIWEEVLTNEAYMTGVFQFFIWLGEQHFRTSKMAMPQEVGAAAQGKPKAKKPKTSRSTK